MKKARLTARQEQILRFIQDYIQTRQCPPTQHEITQAMGFRSRTATRDHLRALEKKGALSLHNNSARGIVLHGGNESDGLPLIGRVAAGQPILAIEHIQARHQVDPGLFRPRADYLLQVQGESMIQAGIEDGDLLAVHQTPEARPGQIVVVRLDNEVTVKRFWQEGPEVRLQAANPEYQDIRIDLREQELHVEGLMVGLIRQRSQDS